METAVYYLFCAMLVGGALGVLFLGDFVNAAMSMLASMLGAAGLMLLMGAYLPAFIMVAVYAGAVMVLFVFIVMLIGDGQEQRSRRKRAALFAVWLLFCAFAGFLAQQAGAGAKAAAEGARALASAQNYGVEMLLNFMLPMQIVGALLLAAVVGVIAIAKPNARRKVKSDML